MRTEHLRQGMHYICTPTCADTRMRHSAKAGAASKLARDDFFFFFQGNLDTVVCRLRATGDSNVHIDLGQFLFVFVSW